LQGLRGAPGGQYEGDPAYVFLHAPTFSNARARPALPVRA
jgi:hypothetical protein